MRTIRKRITQSRAELTQHSGVPDRVFAATGITLDEFRAYDLDTRREILGFLVEQVVIGPGVPGRKGFDPDRVDIVPRRP